MIELAHMQQRTKLKRGDKVAILSPSFGAPAQWPHVYELGLERLRNVFGLEPISFPTTAMRGASIEKRAADLVAAFEQPDIKAIIATLGGNDQVTYVKNLPPAPFAHNPKPFFGFSDNTHFSNFLWQNGVPSYYGGCLFTQFAMHKRMDPFTVEYLKIALFKSGEYELRASDTYNDIGLNWDTPAFLDQMRTYEPTDGWHWDGAGKREGISWGGCLESIDELLRHAIAFPQAEQFDDMVLLLETSEEIPDHEYVRRVLRALGERGLLARIQSLLVGRPQAWNFHDQRNREEKAHYRAQQEETIRTTVRHYNPSAPIVSNMDFGHTNPQIPMPYGMPIRIDADALKIYATF